jgi:transcriptional repressor NrdR
MWCPKCVGKTKVVGTTTGMENERFRVCTKCNYAFSTVEAIKFDDYWKEYAKETFNSSNKIEEQEQEDNQPTQR